MTANIGRGHILQEPTIHDVYTLSDDDIFETGPCTTAPQLPPPPPPPPPKDDFPVRIRHRALTHDVSQLRRIHTVDPTADQLTPPETPSDPSFLIPMPSNHSAGELGAIMVAGIAQKFNFDLIYIVSIWPSGAGKHIDPSLPLSQQLMQRFSAPGSILQSEQRSRTTGRYLAAFGLDQLAQPFKLQNKMLLKALRTDGWNEYEDAAGPFNQAWVCSFNSDFVPLGSHGTKTRILKSTKNRGIIFAAYTKQGNEAMSPTDPAMKKELQAQLHFDVELLVDTLIGKL